MKKILLCLWIFPVGGRSQVLHYVPENNAIRLGSLAPEAAIALGAFDNPAVLHNVQQLTLGLAGEQPFGLQEFRTTGASLAFPLAGGGIGVLIQQRGLAGFSESQPALAAARSLGRVSIGAQFGYYRQAIYGYGSAGCITYGAGVSWMAGDNWQAGLSVFNPRGGYLGPGRNERLAGSLFFQCRYRPGPQCLFAFSAEKSEGRAPGLFAGIYVQPQASLHLSLGWQSNSGCLFFGLGYHKKKVLLGISLGWHPQLGFTPGTYLLFMAKHGKL